MDRLTEDQEKRAADIALWHLSNGEQGKCPDEYVRVQQTVLIGEMFQCSALEAMRLPDTTFDKYLVFAAANKAVNDQLAREKGRHHE